mgnify:FL=1
MRKIALTKNKSALVDNEDFKYLNAYKWYAHKNGNTFYALRSKPRGGGFPRKKLHMHREILKLKEGDGKIVDHINGDGLDNRRQNLRITSPRENTQNSSLHRSGKLVGTKKLPSGNWEARLWFKGKYRYLGVFSSELEAHQAYWKFSKKL